MNHDTTTSTNKRQKKQIKKLENVELGATTNVYVCLQNKKKIKINPRPRMIGSPENRN